MNRFRVKDLPTGYWVVKVDDEIAPTAEHKKDGFIFEGEHWLRYWTEMDGIEIVYLAEDELMAERGENVAPRLPGF